MQQSISILVGDSGLGKTPLAVQLGLSIAGAESFLGRRVRQGRVLYCDAESGIRPFRDMLKVISAHLGFAVKPILS